MSFLFSLLIGFVPSTDQALIETVEMEENIVSIEVEANDVVALETEPVEVVVVTEVEPIAVEQTTPKEHISHEMWDKLLQKHVTAGGKVDYTGFQADEASLDKYIKHLATNMVKKEWGMAEKKAFWINAYNAHAIKLVLSRYPVNSINDVADKPFDKRFIKLGAQTLTLNQIEKSVLKKQFKDPRIHFAINCASYSCPKLYNKAFTMFNVEKQLDVLTKGFMVSEHMSYTEKDGIVKTVAMSQLFNWYKDDFIAYSGSVLAYITAYSGKKFHQKVKISFKEYNWKLNKK